MKTATFKPTNKRRYAGPAGRACVALAGRKVQVLGETTYPAEATGTGKPLSVVFIKSINGEFTGQRMFQVPPKDLIYDEETH